MLLNYPMSMLMVPSTIPVRGVTRCEDRPTCAKVYDWTGNRSLAGVVDWFARAPLRIVVVLAAAVLLTVIARRIIARVVTGVSRVGDAEHRNRQRTSTLGTLLRSVATGLIWTVATITIIGELGVNLSAFAVTATVVGGAIAFGSQQIVRDFLAGIFVVIEDQYGVGDVVDLGFAEGTVERVSLRTTQLRDVDGKVWHIPHGNVARVTNLTQGWAQAVLDVGVARTMAPEAAVAVLRELAAAVALDPTVAASLLGAPEVVGVEALSDDRFVVRVTARTAPDKRGDVLRALRVAVVAAGADGRLAVPMRAVGVEPDEAGPSSRG
jgi:moderate conductance mechanosensitive channel